MANVQECLEISNGNQENRRKKKDSEGKTSPRSLRHLPINDAAHVRNALARLDQTDISEEAKKAALKKIKAAAKKFGIKVSASAQIDYSDLY